MKPPSPWPIAAKTAPVSPSPPHSAISSAPDGGLAPPSCPHASASPTSCTTAPSRQAPHSRASVSSCLRAPTRSAPTTATIVPRAFRLRAPVGPGRREGAGHRPGAGAERGRHPHSPALLQAPRLAFLQGVLRGRPLRRILGGRAPLARGAERADRPGDPPHRHAARRAGEGRRDRSAAHRARSGRNVEAMVNEVRTQAGLPQARRPARTTSVSRSTSPKSASSRMPSSLKR